MPGAAATGSITAIRAMDVLVWGAVAVGILRLWSLLTGIPPLLWWLDETWVSATALPQVLQFDYRPTEDAVRGGDILHLPLWLRALGSMSIVIFTVMFVQVMRVARHVALRAMEGAPFAGDIPTRLRRTAAVVLGLALARLVVDVGTIVGVGSWRPDVERFHSLAVGTDLPALSLGLVIAAIVARVLATAFKRGARLEAEIDGLV